MRMNNIVQDIKKLQDSLEKLYNTSSINYNGNIGQQQQQQQQSSSTNLAHQQLLKDDIRILLDVLECPVFESIVNVQYSLQQLREQFINHPSLLPVDFDIDQTTLELKLNPNIPNDDNNNNNLLINQQQQLNKHHPPTSTSTTFKNQDNDKVGTTTTTTTAAAIAGDHNQFDDYDNRTIPSKFSLQQYMYENYDHQEQSSLGGSGGGGGIRDYCEPDYVNISSQDETFRKIINELAKGRMIQTVELYKPEGKSLGFKVVGLNHQSDSLATGSGGTNNNVSNNSVVSESQQQQIGHHHFDDLANNNNNKKLGIYIQEIHENGIAARSGLLKPRDQILAIDRHLFTNDLSHEDAINILQSAKGVIRLIVARSNDNNNNNNKDDDNNDDVVDDNAKITTTTTTTSISSTTTSPTTTTTTVHNVEDKFITSTTTINNNQQSNLNSIIKTSDTSLLYNNNDVKRSSSNASDSSSNNSSSLSIANNQNQNNNNMVLNTEWIQIDLIELDQENEHGLGFGIVGGRSSGVIVKTIIPGGAAAKDNRLKVGDHILQINGVNMRGMTSDQVAQILRQSNGQRIKLIVARPVDPSLDLQVIQNTLTIVPTKCINDPIELEKQIHLLSIQQQQQCNQENIDYLKQQPTTNDFIDQQQQQNYRHINDTNNNNNLKSSSLNNLVANVSDILSSTNDPQFQSEIETFEVELIKDQQGLGITIAGYVCEKVAEEISGIFIKSIATGSVAERSKMIQINDQIIEVDGRSLYGYNNLQAVDLLRNTGRIVKLKLARYVKGSKYHDQIQKGVMNAEQQLQATATTTVRTNNGPTVIQINSQPSINTSNLMTSGPSSLAHRSPNDLREKWSTIVGPDFDIIIASVTKFCHDGGLGIGLEGVIDIENGNECRPHHYINSIIPNGPVGRNGLLQKNDELLEVNGIRLHGLKHSDVLPLLKDLPIEVQLVCARPKPTTITSANDIITTINNTNNRNPFVVQIPTKTTQQQQSTIDIAKFNTTTNINDVGYPSISPSSSYQLHFQQQQQQQPQQHHLDPSPMSGTSFIDRLVKAKSDGSLAMMTAPIAGTFTGLDDDVSITELSKIRSRSLEPLTGLAMWSQEPQVIKLMKGDRGLGFSILDYQDPMNPNDTVIVIRSLVPGGVAQQDGRLLPGDRLLFVNDQNLENASLDQAVQALKGAPKGVVIVGVAKPLPLPESALHLAAAVASSATITNIDNDKNLVTQENYIPKTITDIDEEKFFESINDMDEKIVDNQFVVVDVDDDVDHHNDLIIPHDHDIHNYNDDHHDNDNDDEIDNVKQKMMDARLTSMPKRQQQLQNKSTANANGITDMMDEKFQQQQQTNEILTTESSPLMMDNINKQHQPSVVNNQMNDINSRKILPLKTVDQDSNICTTTAMMTKTTMMTTTTATTKMVLPLSSPISNDKNDTTKNNYSQHQQQQQPLQKQQQQQHQKERKTSTLSTSSIKLNDNKILLNNFTSSKLLLPTTWEQTIRLTNDSQNTYYYLGMILSLADNSSNGYIVKSIDPNGIIGNDGRIHIGDYIVTLNGKSLRGLSKTDVLAILNDCEQQLQQCKNDDIIIKYIPKSVIANCLTTTTTNTTMMKPETTATIYDDDDDGDENFNKQEKESCHHRIENDNSLENRYENLKIDKNSSLTNTTMNSVRKQQNSISLIKSSEDESMKSQKQLAQSSITNDSNVDDNDDDNEIYDNENNSNQQRTILAEKILVKNDDTMTISPSSSSSSVAKQWGEEIFVELIRSETIGFGISIIGGKEMTNMILLDNNNNDNNMNQNTATATTTLFLSGILIKKILPDSPAAKCGLIKMGDRLLQVDGIDLRHSTHDKAVDVIKKAKSPVKFLIQLLLPLSKQQQQHIIQLNNSSHQQQHQLLINEQSSDLNDKSNNNNNKNKLFTNDDDDDLHDNDVETVYINENNSKRMNNSNDNGNDDTNTIERQISSQSSFQSSTLTSNNNNNICQKQDEDELTMSKMNRSFIASTSTTSTTVTATEKHSHLSSATSIATTTTTTTNEQESVMNLVNVNHDDDDDHDSDDRMIVVKQKNHNNNNISSNKTKSSKIDMKSTKQKKVSSSSTTTKVSSVLSTAKICEESLKDDDVVDDDDEKFSQTSAANIQLTQYEINESLPTDIIEDEFGYSIKKIRKKYSDIDGKTILVDLHKGMAGLGISLAGNRDRTKMSVFICGMHPKGSAYKDGRLCIGDEILEVNGIVLYGRSHLNASAIIKSLACPTYRIIALRRDGALDEMAVKPLTQFPVHLNDFLEEKYCKFKGVRTITVRKATQGLGIMIIEGKRPDVGRGVFVSDIQDGSPAENAGLSVGDMILCVNHIDLIGADYETAANALKCAEGLLTLVIAKPIKLMPYEYQQQQQSSTKTTTSSNISDQQQQHHRQNPSESIMIGDHHQHQHANKIQVLSMNQEELIKSSSSAAALRSDLKSTIINTNTTTTSITNTTTSYHHHDNDNLFPKQQHTNYNNNSMIENDIETKLNVNNNNNNDDDDDDLIIMSNANMTVSLLDNNNMQTTIITTTPSNIMNCTITMNAPNQSQPSPSFSTSSASSHHYPFPLQSQLFSLQQQPSEPQPPPSVPLSYDLDLLNSKNLYHNITTPTATNNKQTNNFIIEPKSLMMLNNMHQQQQQQHTSAIDNRSMIINDKINDSLSCYSNLVTSSSSLSSTTIPTTTTTTTVLSMPKGKNSSSLSLQQQQQQQFHHLHSNINNNNDKLIIKSQSTNVNTMGTITTTSLSSLAAGINIELQSNDYKTCPVRLGDETTIEIVREKMGLGLSIVGGSDTPLNTVIIHEVYPNGAAFIDGRLKPGDQILEVNGENLRHATHEQAIKALRQTPPIIKMKIYRDKNDDDDIDDDFNRENLDIFDVKLTKKPGKGLGLSIVVRRNGNGIYIKDIVEGGIADLDGHLMIGDQIIQVNGHDLTNVEDAALMLKTAKGVINLKIGRLKCNHPPSPLPLTSQQQQQQPSSTTSSMNLNNSKYEELSVDETKEIVIEKGMDGLGFSIVGGYGSIHGNLPICIRKIFPNSPTSIDGRLNEGDIILAVNNIDITKLSHDNVVDLLKNVNGKVKLLIYEMNNISTTTTSSSTSY